MSLHSETIWKENFEDLSLMPAYIWTTRATVIRWHHHHAYPIEWPDSIFTLQLNLITANCRRSYWSSLSFSGAWENHCTISAIQKQHTSLWQDQFCAPISGQSGKPADILINRTSLTGDGESGVARAGHSAWVARSAPVSASVSTASSTTLRYPQEEEGPVG